MLADARRRCVDRERRWVDGTDDVVGGVSTVLGENAAAHTDEVIAFLEALGSSLELRVALERAYPALLALIPLDHAALLVDTPGQVAGRLEWGWTTLPARLQRTYSRIAAHDFVRAAVAARPHVVLRDHQMLPRAELTASVPYCWARDAGTPIEQVMAVALCDEGWHGRLALFRSDRRPFSDHESELLRRLVPSFANAVRHWLRLRSVLPSGSGLEPLLRESAASRGRTSHALALSRRFSLTPREGSVGVAVVRGWDNRTIATELGCSVGTVKKHLQRIFDKVGVDSRTAFVARVIESTAAARASTVRDFDPGAPPVPLEW